MNLTARAVATLLGVTMLPLSGLPAVAQSQSGATTAAASNTGSITGAVADQQNGLPLANAVVSLFQGSTRIAQTRTNAKGVFAFQEPAGIYDVVVEGTEAEHVTVVMTLTSPMCPVGPLFKKSVEDKVKSIEGVKSAKADITFTPPWDPREMASDDVKTMLGIW